MHTGQQTYQHTVQAIIQRGPLSTMPNLSVAAVIAVAVVVVITLRAG